jgi:hypothetical protein
MQFFCYLPSSLFVVTVFIRRFFLLFLFCFVCLFFIGARFNVLTCTSFVVCPLGWPCLPRQGYCV